MVRKDSDSNNWGVSRMRRFRHFTVKKTVLLPISLSIITEFNIR